MHYFCEAVQGNRISSSAFQQPDPKTSARISLIATSSIEGTGDDTVISFSMHARGLQGAAML